MGVMVSHGRLFPSINYAAPDPYAHSKQGGVARLTAHSSPDPLSRPAKPLSLLLSCREKFLGSLAAGRSCCLLGECQREGAANAHTRTLLCSTYSTVLSIFVMPASFAIAEKAPCFLSSSSGLSYSTILPACSTITLAAGNKKA